MRLRQQQKFSSKKIQKKTDSSPLGLILQNNFLDSSEYVRWQEWLQKLCPIWETRYKNNEEPGSGTETATVTTTVPTSGYEQRRLLRPVYWYGNWQFACLGYYTLPNGTKNRCIKAEPFPDFVQKKINLLEAFVKTEIPSAFIPRKWHLNTLLINYYGNILENGKKIDQARLGEHKDHEPGPVASVSFGAKALFQFVSSPHRQANSQVVYQKWLEDNSLLVFSGDKFKNRLFHRVQRVDRKLVTMMNTSIPNYETRRINLTFRYVPEEYLVEYKDLPEPLRSEIDPYIESLGKNSLFFKELSNLKIYQRSHN